MTNAYRVIIGMLSATLLSACSPASNPDESAASSEAMSQRCVTHAELLEQGVDLYRTRQSLDTQSLIELRTLLSKADLSPLQSLRDLGGTEELTSDLCLWLYDTYNARHNADLSREDCVRNLEPDQQNFIKYGAPIVLRTWRLDDTFLLLTVVEEGLGGKLLFSYVYQPNTDTLLTVPVTELNALPLITSVRYRDGMLHYERETIGTPGDEQDPCPGTEVATFDLQTGEMAL